MLHVDRRPSTKHRQIFAPVHEIATEAGVDSEYGYSNLDPARFSLQWAQPLGVRRGSITKSTFTPTAAQFAQKMSVQVTGKLSGYTTVSKKSVETGVVAR
jgi:hypothetical protein